MIDATTSGAIADSFSERISSTARRSGSTAGGGLPMADSNTRFVAGLLNEADGDGLDVLFGDRRDHRDAQVGDLAGEGIAGPAGVAAGEASVGFAAGVGRARFSGDGVLAHGRDSGKGGEDSIPG